MSREERRDAWVAFATLFFILAGHAMLETARDALFLAELPAARLPIAYLAITLLVALASRFNNDVGQHFRRRRLTAVTTALFALLTLGFWTLVTSGEVLFVYAFYVWTGLVATVLVVQFWGTISGLFNVAQAKQLFAWIGLGAVLGATLGSLGARLVLTVGESVHLLVTGAACLGIAAVGPLLLSRVERTPHKLAPEQAPPEKEVLARHKLQGETYLQRVWWLVLAAAMTVTSVDFLFKSVVAKEIPAGELGDFFATYYATVNGVSLGVQLLAAPWLLRTLGVNRALLVMPALLLASALGFVVFAGLVPVLLLKGIDGSLRYSVNRTGLELLYLPLSARVRDHFKTFIDGVGQRLGQALASLGILGAITLGATHVQLGVATALLAGGWVVAAVGIRSHYVRMYRRQLRMGMVETQAVVPELDLNSLEALLGALSSPDDSEVIAALDMFEAHGRANLVPALILYHPSRRVVLRAFELLNRAGHPEVPKVSRRLLDHRDPVVRGTALRAYAMSTADRPLLQASLDDENPEVRASALACMIELNMLGEREAAPRLRAIIEGGDRASKAALARAVRHCRSPRIVPILEGLSRTEDLAVLGEVVRSMETVPHARYLEPLVSMLGWRGVRPAVRAALLSLGDPALEHLGECLQRTHLDRRIRRHLPRTISRFESARAVEILTEQLAAEPYGDVRYKIIRGLGRLRRDHPLFPINEPIITEVIRADLHRAAQLLRWNVSLQEVYVEADSRADGALDLLYALCRETELNAIERVFRLLQVLWPGEDFALIHQSLRSGDSKRRASGKELLEYVAPPNTRPLILALVSERSDRERWEALAASSGGPQELLPVSRLLYEMLHDDADIFRALAAHVIGELGLQDLRGQLQATLRDSDPIGDVYVHALELLRDQARGAV